MAIKLANTYYDFNGVHYTLKPIEKSNKFVNNIEWMEFLWAVGMCYFSIDKIVQRR